MNRHCWRRLRDALPAVSVVLFRDRGLLSRAIRGLSGGAYSHAAFCVRIDLPEAPGRMVTVEALGRGLDQRPAGGAEQPLPGCPITGQRVSKCDDVHSDISLIGAPIAELLVP